MPVRVTKLLPVPPLIVTLLLVGAADGVSAAAAADRRVCKRAALKDLLETRSIYRQTKRNAGGLSGVKCLRINDDKRHDALFAISSGGTAGNIAWGVALGGPKGRGRIAKLTQSHARLGVGIHETEIGRLPAIAYPVYNPGDGNCCPSGGYVIQSYEWLSGSLVPAVRREATRFPRGFDAKVYFDR